MSRENLLTLLLLIATAGLGLWQITPRLVVREQPIIRVQPNVVVSIAGAIQQPGRYELPWGSTLLDLIEIAGGLSSGAEETMVNFALPLTNGQALVIPFASSTMGERISLNTASRWELQSLPGVGPALADRIVKQRPYFRVEDLLEVSGIGEATLAAVKDLVKP